MEHTSQASLQDTIQMLLITMGSPPVHRFDYCILMYVELSAGGRQDGENNRLYDINESLPIIHPSIQCFYQYQGSISKDFYMSFYTIVFTPKYFRRLSLFFEFFLYYFCHRQHIQIRQTASYKQIYLFILLHISRCWFFLSNGFTLFATILNTPLIPHP